MRRPSQRTWIIAGLSAAAVIAAGAFVLSQLPAPVARTAADAPHSSSAPNATPSTGATTPAGSGGAEASPGDGPTSRSTPPAAGKRFTTEVIPANPAPTPALPASKPLPYPVRAPLPASASAIGKLVAGYPQAVLPQAPGSDVATSSVAAQAGHLQVTLEAKTAQGVTDVVAFYRQTLAKYGMYDSPAPAIDGSTSVAFSRDGNSVTLTATPGDSGTSYVLFGAFTTAG